MTAIPPSAVVARPPVWGSHFYGQGSGTLYDSIGSQVAGQLLVAVVFAGTGVYTGGLVYTPRLETSAGALVVNFTNAANTLQPSDLFVVSWAYVPASAAGVALRVATDYSSPSGRNLVVDTSTIAWMGADPSIFPVGAASPSGGWSTPTFQAPYDGVGLHVFCQQDYGQAVIYDPFGEIVPGPYGTGEFDGNVPLMVSGCSAVQDHHAGPTATIPQTYSPGSVRVDLGFGNQPDTTNTQIKCAALILPRRLGDSAGELVT